MTYEEFKKCLQKCGLTNREFANLTGKNERSISNLSSKNSIPDNLAIIAKLLVILAENNIDFVNELKSLQVKKAMPRGQSFNNSEGDK